MYKDDLSIETFNNHTDSLLTFSPSHNVSSRGSQAIHVFFLLHIQRGGLKSSPNISVTPLLTVLGQSDLPLT